MSPATATASPPVAAILAATASAAGERISARITRAPSAANFSAAASPIPLPAPLMKARLPLSRMSLSPLRRPSLALPSDSWQVASFVLKLAELSR